MKQWLVIPFFLIASNCLTQQKFEQEKRVRENEVPPQSIEILGQLEIDSKIRWYKETGLSGFSFEAKTKKGKRRLSIEFSSDGKFEDLEIDTRMSELPNDTKEKILELLQKENGRYKIKKVQQQLSGEIASISTFLKDSKLDIGNEITIKYELVISTKENGTFIQIEYLFDAGGKLLKKSKIIEKMNDNIDF